MILNITFAVHWSPANVDKYLFQHFLLGFPFLQSDISSSVNCFLHLVMERKLFLLWVDHKLSAEVSADLPNKTTALDIHA